MAAAASATGLSSSFTAGIAMMISVTPATFAGMAFISTVDG